MEPSSADNVATAVMFNLGLLGCLVTLFDAMNFPV
jgi:hypothetical protein